MKSFLLIVIIASLSNIVSVSAHESSRFSSVMDNEDWTSLWVWFGIPFVLSTIFVLELTSAKNEMTLITMRDDFKWAWRIFVVAFNCVAPILGLAAYHHNRNYEFEYYACTRAGVPYGEDPAVGFSDAAGSTYTTSEGVKIYGMAVGYGSITEYYYLIGWLIFAMYAIYAVSQIVLIWGMRRGADYFKKSFKIFGKIMPRVSTLFVSLAIVMKIIFIGIAIATLVFAGHQNRRPDDKCGGGAQGPPLSVETPNLADDLLSMVAPPFLTNCACLGVDTEGAQITSPYPIFLVVMLSVTIGLAAVICIILIVYLWKNRKSNDAEKMENIENNQQEDAEDMRAIEKSEATNPLLTAGYAGKSQKRNPPKKAGW